MICAISSEANCGTHALNDGYAKDGSDPAHVCSSVERQLGQCCSQNGQAAAAVHRRSAAALKTWLCLITARYATQRTQRGYDREGIAKETRRTQLFVISAA
jgi:hypothetical protein